MTCIYKKEGSIEILLDQPILINLGKMRAFKITMRNPNGNIIGIFLEYFDRAFQFLDRVIYCMINKDNSTECALTDDKPDKIKAALSWRPI